MTRRPSLWSALLLLACSSAEDKKPEAGPPRGPAGGIIEADSDSIPVTPHVNPMTGGSAGAGAVGGGSGAGSGGASGAAGAPVEFVSEPPGAELDLVIVEGEPGLQVLNSHSSQRGVASILVEWFAEVRNDGQSIACYPRADVQLRDASDAVVWQTDALGTYADTKPYFVPELTTGTGPCLAPGEVGVLYANGLLDAPVAIDSIARVYVAMSSDVYPGTEPHPEPPDLANLVMTEFIAGGGSWLVEGDLTAASAMELTDVTVYLRNPLTGLYDARRFVTRIEPLAVGETWHFESNNGETGPYTDMTPFVSWYYP